MTSEAVIWRDKLLRLNLLNTLRISVSTSRFHSDVTFFNSVISDSRKYRSYSSGVVRSAVLSLAAAVRIQLLRNANNKIL